MSTRVVLHSPSGYMRITAARPHIGALLFGVVEPTRQRSPSRYLDEVKA
jgi:hypothetical protein